MRRLPLALLLAAACNPGFDPQYRVLDLRILAVRSQVEGTGAADAAPGDTVRLDALVANPLGRTPLTVRWFYCLPSGAGTIPSCVDPELLRDPDALAARPDVFELPPGESTTVLVPEVPPEALALLLAEVSRNPSFLCSLYVEIPVLAVAEAGERRDVALKTVRVVPTSLPPEVESRYERNRNPSVGAVVEGPVEEQTCSGGTPLAPAPSPNSFPSGSTVLCGAMASGVAETYDECDGTGAVTATVPETLFWQWYVTGGELPEFDGLGNAIGDSVEFERPDGPFAIWSILRDGRGGVAWERYEVP